MNFSGYFSTEELMPGSDQHYNFFESLISGRDLNTEFDTVGDRFKKIFPAQILKGKEKGHPLLITYIHSYP